MQTEVAGASSKHHEEEAQLTMAKLDIKKAEKAEKAARGFAEESSASLAELQHHEKLVREAKARIAGKLALLTAEAVPAGTRTSGAKNFRCMGTACA
jgi:hypothetical protein